MTNKIQKNALETDFDNGDYISNTLIKNQVGSLIRYKIIGLTKRILIPDDLIAEAENFIARNMKYELNYQYCERCLKAHLLKKSDELGLTKREKKFIESKFKEETGHLGYYLDEEKLVKI